VETYPPYLHIFLNKKYNVLNVYVIATGSIILGNKIKWEEELFFLVEFFGGVCIAADQF
jgi:hypothetical protein